MVRNGHRTRIARGLIAVPSNVGPRTMPDYDALAAQGIYELSHDGANPRCEGLRRTERPFRSIVRSSSAP